MIKNMFKRASLATRRKTSRTIILVLILFVMANLLLATVSIKKSVESSMNFAKEKLGGVVYLQTDTDSIRQKTMQSAEKGEEVDINIPKITQSLVKGIGESSYIKDYTYTISSTSNASGFKTVKTAQNEREKQYQDALDKAKDAVNDAKKDFDSAKKSFNSGGNKMIIVGGGPNGGGGISAPRFNFSFDVDINDPNLKRGDTQIIGIDNFNYVDGIESGSISIIDGVAYSKDAKNEALISKEVSEANKLKVGDKIKVKTVSAKKTITVTFTIKGIYEATSEEFNYNTIYTNLSSTKQFLSTNKEEDIIVENVEFYLTSASKKDLFLKEVESKEITLENLKLDIDDSSYKTMVGPIENVGSFANTVMWIVIAASVVIITLIVVINIKDRRYEMGVLLSLGATRKNIIAQIFIELAIVAIVGFSLSIATSNILADKMGEKLLSDQITSVEDEKENNVENGFMRYFNNQNNTKPIEELDINASIEDYLIIFGIGFSIIIIAMIVPSINILKYQPKTILSGKE